METRVYAVRLKGQESDFPAVYPVSDEERREVLPPAFQ